MSIILPLQIEETTVSHLARSATGNLVGFSSMLQVKLRGNQQKSNTVLVLHTNRNVSSIVLVDDLLKHERQGYFDCREK